MSTATAGGAAPRRRTPTRTRWRALRKSPRPSVGPPRSPSSAIWRDVARDLALVALGEPGDVRQIDLLDDLDAAARRLPASFAATQLRRLDLAGERLEGNVSPELVVDALALGWAG